MNFNGKAFVWEHNLTNGKWIKQTPTIHTAHLKLIAEFEELKLNDFDLTLKAHPAHDVMRMEQLNILNDLAGRLHGTRAPTRSVGTQCYWHWSTALATTQPVLFLWVWFENEIVLAGLIWVDPYPFPYTVNKKKQRREREFSFRCVIQIVENFVMHQIQTEARI